MHPHGQLIQRFSGIAALLLLVGCNGAAHAPAAAQKSGARTAVSPTEASAADRAESLPVIDIPVFSPVNHRQIAARFTCTGADRPLPLRWTTIPLGTVETDVFVMEMEPTHSKPFLAWAVARLPPATRQLLPGSLPARAIIGRNGFGRTRYSVCPPKRVTARYLVFVDPLPRSIPVKHGFNGRALVVKATQAAKHEGQLSFSYRRP